MRYLFILCTAIYATTFLLNVAHAQTVVPSQNPGEDYSTVYTTTPGSDDPLLVDALAVLMPIEQIHADAFAEALEARRLGIEKRDLGFGAQLMRVYGSSLHLSIVTFEDRVAAYEITLLPPSDHGHDILSLWKQKLPAYKPATQVVNQIDGFGQRRVTNYGRIEYQDGLLTERYQRAVDSTLGFTRPFEKSNLEAVARFSRIGFSSPSNWSTADVFDLIELLDSTQGVGALTLLLRSLHAEVRIMAAISLEALKWKGVELPATTLAAIEAIKMQSFGVDILSGCLASIGHPYETITDGGRGRSGVPEIVEEHGGVDILEAPFPEYEIDTNNPEVTEALQHLVIIADFLGIEGKSISQLRQLTSKHKYELGSSDLGFGGKLFTAFGTENPYINFLVHDSIVIGWQFTIGSGSEETLYSLLNHWNAKHKLYFFRGRHVRPSTVEFSRRRYLGELVVLDKQASERYQQAIYESLGLSAEDIEQIAPFATALEVSAPNFEVVEPFNNGHHSREIKRYAQDQHFAALTGIAVGLNASARIEAAVMIEMLRLRGTLLPSRTSRVLEAIKALGVDVEFMSGCISGSEPVTTFIENAARGRVNAQKAQQRKSQPVRQRN